eukprot:comp21147_c0_seq1/m.44802 comp21147_c0_seq1/g.44802  ORF comp21147_c0_seq1/g.44802 comp21147_c0_seq1/m.44802 type:complete len:475 (-) comp21147_c0_seq1:15-1439(-)
MPIMHFSRHRFKIFMNILHRHPNRLSGLSQLLKPFTKLADFCFNRFALVATLVAKERIVVTAALLLTIARFLFGKTLLGLALLLHDVVHKSSVAIGINIKRTALLPGIARSSLLCKHLCIINNNNNIVVFLIIRAIVKNKPRNFALRPTNDLGRNVGLFNRAHIRLDLGRRCTRSHWPAPVHPAVRTVVSRPRVCAQRNRAIAVATAANRHRRHMCARRLLGPSSVGLFGKRRRALGRLLWRRCCWSIGLSGLFPRSSGRTGARGLLWRLVSCGVRGLFWRMVCLLLRRWYIFVFFGFWCRLGLGLGRSRILGRLLCSCGLLCRLFLWRCRLCGRRGRGVSRKHARDSVCAWHCCGLGELLQEDVCLVWLLACNDLQGIHMHVFARGQLHTHNCLFEKRNLGLAVLFRAFNLALVIETFRKTCCLLDSKDDVHQILERRASKQLFCQARLLDQRPKNLLRLGNNRRINTRHFAL